MRSYRYIGHQQERIAACLFWVLITTLCFWPLISGKTSVFFGDLSLYFIPQFANVQEALNQGRFLFWNHTILSGVPHVGNPQGWFLYPSTWLLLWVEPWHAAGLIPIIHIVIAALGMHILIRQLSLSMIAAYSGAGVYAFSSVLLTKAQFPNMVQAIAWSPWVIASVLACIQRPSIKVTIVAICTGALALSAGHAQITWMDLLICTGIVVVRCRSWKALKCLLLACLGTLSLSAVYLLPVLEIASWSGRDRMTLMEANRFRVPLAGIQNYMLTVYPGGSPWTKGGFQWGGNSWETSAYFGPLSAVTILVLFLQTLFTRTQKRTLFVYSTLLGVSGWWLSIGVSGLLYTAVFYGIPGAKAFHDPARFLHFVHLATAILLALCVNELQRYRFGTCFAIAIGTLNTTALLVQAPTWYPTVSTAVWRAAAHSYAPLKGDVVYTQNDVEVWRNYANSKSFVSVSSDANVLAFLHTGIPNIPGIFGVRSAGGYEPVAPKTTRRLQNWTGVHPITSAATLSELGVAMVIHNGTHVEIPKVPSTRKVGEDVVTIETAVNQLHVTVPASDKPVWVALNRSAGWDVIANKVILPRSAMVSGTALPKVFSDGEGRWIPPQAMPSHVLFRYAPNSVRFGLFLMLFTLGILGAYYSVTEYR